jgi:hypothetical protein
MSGPESGRSEGRATGLPRLHHEMLSAGTGAVHLL